MNNIKKTKMLPRLAKPYMLVICGGHSAIYNRKYKLVGEYVPKELIRHAEEHHTQIEFGFKLSLPEQQPSWLRDKPFRTSYPSECICIHLFKDSSTDQWVRAIPYDI